MNIYDFSYMWNLENIIVEQTKQKQKKKRKRLIDTEKKLRAARGEGLRGLGKKGEGIKYRLIVTE